MSTSMTRSSASSPVSGRWSTTRQVGSSGPRFMRVGLTTSPSPPPPDCAAPSGGPMSAGASTGRATPPVDEPSAGTEGSSEGSGTRGMGAQGRGVDLFWRAGHATAHHYSEGSERGEEPGHPATRACLAGRQALSGPGSPVSGRPPWPVAADRCRACE